MVALVHLPAKVQSLLPGQLFQLPNTAHDLRMTVLKRTLCNAMPLVICSRHTSAPLQHLPNRAPVFVPLGPFQQNFLPVNQVRQGLLGSLPVVLCFFRDIIPHEPYGVYVLAIVQNLDRVHITGTNNQSRYLPSHSKERQLTKDNQQQALVPTRLDGRLDGFASLHTGNYRTEVGSVACGL